jgi:hypothetical protein
MVKLLAKRKLFNMARSKLTRSHTSYIEAAAPLLKFAAKSDEVTKVSLGVIKTGLKVAPQRIKIRIDKNCLLVSVRGSTSVQDLFVYTTNPERVQKQLEDLYK